MNGSIETWSGIDVFCTKGKLPTNFFIITCPCGVVVQYGMNELPILNTKHPCDHPDHWTIRFTEKTL